MNIDHEQYIEKLQQKRDELKADDKADKERKIKIMTPIKELAETLKTAGEVSRVAFTEGNPFEQYSSNVCLVLKGKQDSWTIAIEYRYAPKDTFAIFFGRQSKPKAKYELLVKYGMGIYYEKRFEFTEDFDYKPICKYVVESIAEITHRR